MVESRPGGGSELEVIQRYYDFVLRLVPEVGKFPRSHRFTLGQKMETVVYDGVDEFMIAKYAHGGAKKEVLDRLNVRLERLRFLLRLALDLKVLSFEKYDSFTKDLLTVGRHLGQWIKWADRRRGP